MRSKAPSSLRSAGALQNLAGPPTVHGEPPFVFRMHWDHEPLAVLCRTESVDKSDALQTLRVACRVRGPRDSVWTVCAFSAARPRQATIQGTGTIAWIAMSVEMLRLTAHPIVADELELSTLNSVLGLHSPNGRWVTFNTPMDGTRKASAHDIVFQAGAAWA